LGAVDVAARVVEEAGQRPVHRGIVRRGVHRGPEALLGAIGILARDPEGARDERLWLGGLAQLAAGVGAGGAHADTHPPPSSCRDIARLVTGILVRSRAGLRPVPASPLPRFYQIPRPRRTSGKLTARCRAALLRATRA